MGSSAPSLTVSAREYCTVFRGHVPTREALLRHSADLFDLVRNKNLDPGIGHRYASPPNASTEISAHGRFSRSGPSG
ncbi:hypothetical protein [Streptomyces sp. enrichment culture]|uniref:hypothetical protein n=1 Tax=Streptomyces sp. enrichment culture TaxID=1795815 RepID=UPI003F570ECC